MTATTNILQWYMCINIYIYIHGIQTLCHYVNPSSAPKTKKTCMATFLSSILFRTYRRHCARTFLLCHVLRLWPLPRSNATSWFQLRLLIWTCRRQCAKFLLFLGDHRTQNVWHISLPLRLLLWTWRHICLCSWRLLFAFGPMQRTSSTIIPSHTIIVN